MRGIGEDVQLRQILKTESRIFLALLLYGPLTFNELRALTKLPKATLHRRLNQPNTGLIPNGVIKVMNAWEASEWCSGITPPTREEWERLLKSLEVTQRSKVKFAVTTFYTGSTKQINTYSSPTDSAFEEKDSKNSEALFDKIFNRILFKNGWDASRKYYYLNFEFKPLIRGSDGKPVFEEESP